MRQINRIVIHSTATYADMNVDADWVRQVHVNENGWADIGYHFVICRDGTVELGRPIATPGAHVRGFNSDSIGIAMVGGLGEDDQAEDNFTDEQFKALANLITTLDSVEQIAGSEVVGHNELDSKKECPCFDLAAFMAENFDE
ncbi:N-acetylmuramoyl-L-alanine amidase [Bacterioplanoides sp.]|uniref:N-acetylmuramoyl-L-alanine amidase n=1 Tax=Bacterioplanoides sp. TaxID=2066072 RepID=UPI003AFF9AD1